MKRKTAREFLMKVLFQMDASGEFSADNIEKIISDTSLGEQRDYCTSLLNRVCEHKESIDELIAKFSTSRKVERMPKTDISILRLSVTEIIYFDDIPVAVSINEAVELAKKYGTEQSPKFVNAILGSIGNDRSSDLRRTSS